MNIYAKLVELGITLPKPAAPIASYVPLVVTGDTVTVSGQLPFMDGALVTGRLGESITPEDAANAARACGLMLLAQLDAAGLLERTARVVKLGVFVNSTADFIDQPKIANGASDLMVTVFGEAGRHARSAVGVPSLPLGAAVEVDAIFALQSA